MNITQYCGAALLAVLTLAGAHAQTYPVKPVRIIVPLAPGGTVTSSRVRSRSGSSKRSASRSSSRTGPA